MKYARRAPGMILFEVQQGFVARGASIAWLSQYPKEEDIFLPPLTALEVSGSRIEGAVVVVELRPSMQANISGLRSGAQDLAKFDRLMDEAAKRRGGQGLKPVRCYANGSHSAGAKAVWCYANAARCCAGTDDACAQHTSAAIRASKLLSLAGSVAEGANYAAADVQRRPGEVPAGRACDISK